MLNPTSHCWCGNNDLQPFSSGYRKCARCETLVAVQMPDATLAKITDDEHDFYGREYWFSHQEKDLGFPNIGLRSRADLPERCLHWLRTTLKYKLPPGSALELGCAHGGFVALLLWAGFKSMGLELSPWVAEFARKSFGVPMLVGPVEDHQIERGSLDMVAFMDVLEHLLDPLATMRHCLGLLKPAGVLVIQTPHYPEGEIHEELVAKQDPFLEQLKDIEHLFLFSQSSIRELFQRLGAEYIGFEPAIFSQYDMFLVVSRQPLVTHAPEEIAEALTSTPNGRLVLALLDKDDQLRELAKRHAESEADRAARLEALLALEKLRAKAAESEKILSSPTRTLFFWVRRMAGLFNRKD